MRDPWEGRGPDGVVVTGADIERVPADFRPVLDRAERLVTERGDGASLYVYGSVATGQARPGTSDVDLLTIGVSEGDTSRLASVLSAEFAGLCQAVELAACRPDDLVGSSDRAYGMRAFLHHYCVHLVGPSRDHAETGFLADRRLARAFNGDIAEHAAGWHAEAASSDAADVGRRLARKSLLAVAGLVSVHDRTWTTDRDGAAERWKQVDERLAPGLDDLVAWSNLTARACRASIGGALDTVDAIVDRFAVNIGLWTEPVQRGKSGRS